MSKLYSVECSINIEIAVVLLDGAMGFYLRENELKGNFIEESIE